MKVLAKVGNGNTTHLGQTDVGANGESFIYTTSGADHLTNRQTKVGFVGPFNWNKVTCKKCLKQKESK